VHCGQGSMANLQLHASSQNPLADFVKNKETKPQSGFCIVLN
tara:strand:+ start:905 stop:1030 length:126 start_codon:yes stop_codon:yes gene_type:complete